MLFKKHALLHHGITIIIIGDGDGSLPRTTGLTRSW
jgi:hypothetical protein